MKPDPLKEKLDTIRDKIEVSLTKFEHLNKEVNDVNICIDKIRDKFCKLIYR